MITKQDIQVAASYIFPKQFCLGGPGKESDGKSRQ